MQNVTYNVGIYCRLSRDDGNDNESLSIQNQKELLTNYVLSKNWNIYKTYVDDGYSGTNFERPGFKELINDIEEKRINLVITKDLSRLGRNYIHTGFYTEEYFPNHNVRYIAINDNVDTEGNENEFAPFKNIINEWYAKDISKKVKSSIELKIRQGKSPSGNPLYGYLYDENRKRIINPETENVVKFIFDEYIKGKSTKEIAEELKELKVLTPMYYLFYKFNQIPKNISNDDENAKYNWGKNHVAKMIRNIEYTGVIRLLKKHVKSFKVKKKVKNNEEDIITLEAPQIISLEIYKRANQLMDIQIKNSIDLVEDKYRDMLTCAHCGEPLKYVRKKNKKGEYYYLYRCRNKDCNHRFDIQVKEIDSIVKEELDYLEKAIIKNEEKFRKFALNYCSKNVKKEESIKDSLMLELIRKNEDIDKLISTIVEAKANDEIPNSTYQKLMKEYKNAKQDIESKLLKFNFVEKIKETESTINYAEMADKIIGYFKENKSNLLNHKVISSLIKSIVIKPKKMAKNGYNIVDEIEIIYYKGCEIIGGFIGECRDICKTIK